MSEEDPSDDGGASDDAPSVGRDEAPAEQSGDDAGADTTERTETGRAEPLSGLADRVRERRGRRGGEDAFESLSASESDADAGTPRTGETGNEGDPFEALGESEASEGDDPFETMDVATVDEEDVWATLEEGERGDEGGVDPTEQMEVGAGDPAERVEREDPNARRADHVVPKATYCQRCQFLAAPPDLRCTHEGTEIVAVESSEEFRVRGCPMVEEGGAVVRDTGGD